MPNISFVGAKKRKTRHSGRFRRMLVQHAHQASAQRSLLSLVDELLLNIIDQIDSHQTLCNLAATCTQFQDLTEPYIWRSLLVLTGAHAQLINTALDSREERIDFVQELSIRYRIQHKDGIEHLNHFIGLMGKLRRLTVESPCPNNTEWRSGMYFDGATRIDYTRLLEHAVYPPGDSLPTLPMLQSLTLHGHGQEGSKFIFGRAAVMFLHPTLRSITVSCLEFDATIALDNISNAKINSTPLQSLTLIECNVNIQFLDLVLSLPKALKELSIGERLHTFQECVPSDNPNTRTSSPLFLSALQRQSHSLERLIHIGGAVRYLTKLLKDDEGAEKLRSLTSLQHLELGLESPLFYYLFQNGFPPNLTTFKILDTAWSQAFRSMPHASSRSVLKRITDIVTKQIPPSLPAGFTLDLHFSDFSIARISPASESSDRDHRFYLANVFLDRPAVYKIASVMSSRSCRFRIFRECFLSGTSYIPPYMYGEETPVQKLMYDSNDYWCFEGDDYQIVDDEGRRKELKDARELIRCGRCVARGMECRNLGNGASCLPCWAGRLACSWEKDDHGVWIWSATQSFGDGE